MMSSSLAGRFGFNRIGASGARFMMASKMIPEVSPRNGTSSGCHLVQDDAERKQVGAGIERLAPHLLRRHVSHRAQRRARTGEVLLRVPTLGLGHVGGIERPVHVLRHLGQAEIENLG